jgi:hypothetical protein
VGAGLFPLAYIDFQQDPPEDLLESIDDELANLMLPTAIECEWRSLAASKGNEVSSELAVIHFKGTCAVTVTLTEIHPRPLGWTDLSDGEILPFSEINCDGVRLFLRRDLPRMPEVNVNREVAYGRAIARVLAHELYHNLCQNDQARRVGYRPTNLYGSGAALEQVPV